MATSGDLTWPPVGTFPWPWTTVLGFLEGADLARETLAMPAPKKYDTEFRERAMRMYRDRLAEGEDSKLGARRHVGALLDLNQATLRNWIEDGERAEGTRPPSATARAADSEEVRVLKKRVAELERANDILKTSAAFFAQAELDRRLK